MLFNSLFFIFCFIPLFFLTYFCLPEKWKNTFTLVASILFYAWGAPKFVFVLSAAVGVDYYFAKQIARTEGNNRKYLWMLSIGINLSILLYFKYTNFFVENILWFFGSGSQSIGQIFLPIGLSFFTFHEISYLTDVYRKTKQPFNNIVNYALYIFLFPQLISGPIIRFHEIADQIENRKSNDTEENRLLGFFRFAIGLAKKVLIADVIGVEVDKIFSAAPGDIGMVTAWVGAALNLLNIYFDFSGYSDMAIGLALVLGFRFPENFNSPLISESITEFWQRWHISLGRWMRDYLYHPLGGSKGSSFQTARNIFLIFFVMGFWHGAQWKYILWGSMFGLIVIMERFFLLRLTKKTNKWFRIVFTLSIFIQVLILFTAKDVYSAWQYFLALYSFTGDNFNLFFSTKTELALLAAMFLAFGSTNHTIQTFAAKLFQPQESNLAYVGMALTTICLFIVCSSMLFVSGFHPFLYFKF